ncbi:hypothetical protein F1D97_10010 [Cellulomonas palmilytica]|nr:hypothetical protein F1D97_10010 [Cellulomonas palmilytica]
MPGRRPDPPPGLGRRLAERFGRPDDEPSGRVPDRDAPADVTAGDPLGDTADEAPEPDDERWEDRTWSE